MHERGLVLGVNQFRDLIVQFGEAKDKRLNGFTIFIGNIVVFP
jgi:hypothetical protein